MREDGREDAKNANLSRSSRENLVRVIVSTRGLSL